MVEINPEKKAFLSYTSLAQSNLSCVVTNWNVLVTSELLGGGLSTPFRAFCWSSMNAQSSQAGMSIVTVEGSGRSSRPSYTKYAFPVLKKKNEI